MLTNTEICIVSEQAVMIQCIWYDFIFLNNEVCMGAWGSQEKI